MGDHRFDALLDDMSAPGRAARLALAKRTLAQLQAIPAAALSQDNQVDAAMLANALRAQIWTTQTWKDWQWNPLIYQSTAGDALYTLMAREFAPLPVRLNAAARRMAALPNIFAAARASLLPARVPAPHAETYAAQNAGLKSILNDMIAPQRSALSDRDRMRLDAAMKSCTTAIEAHQRWIEAKLVPNAKGNFRAGAAAFDAQLGYTLHGDLSRAQVRSLAETALRQVRAQMYQTALQALAGSPDAPFLQSTPTQEQEQRIIRMALDLASKQRPSRHQLVETSTEATEIARRFVKARDLITLPEGPVRIILMPEFQRGYAVAYCDSPGPLERHLDTFYAVSPIPDDWTDAQAESFLREYNTRGIQDIAVHEAMPGHYVQIWHANRHPSVLRAALASGSFIEGWAVYAETMMVEQGFLAHDPLYKLTQLKVLLRSITNAIIDQAIHVDGMTQAEMMKLLTETAFQEEREAAGKWRRAQLSVSQLSTYFVGFQEHMTARAAVMQARGASFNLKAYHDEILSHGSPPMKFAQALTLNEPIPA
jgi:uncharacterized protein (DUF885 family)